MPKIKVRKRIKIKIEKVAIIEVKMLVFLLKVFLINLSLPAKKKL